MRVQKYPLLCQYLPPPVSWIPATLAGMNLYLIAVLICFPHQHSSAKQTWKGCRDIIRVPLGFWLASNGPSTRGTHEPKVTMKGPEYSPWISAWHHQKKKKKNKPEMEVGDRLTCCLFQASPLAFEWVGHTGLFKGFPGNETYSNGGNGESLLEDIHLPNTFKISKSIKVQSASCILVPLILSSLHGFLQ